MQLDIYGDVLDAVYLYAMRNVGKIDGKTAKEVAGLADIVARSWQLPDSGLWELRAEPRQQTHSKAMCWVALHRAIELAEEGVIPDRSDSWRAEATKVRRYVDEHCWDEKRRTYVRFPDERELDASRLTLSLFGYEEPSAERMLGTIDAIRGGLGQGPLLARYGSLANNEEGAFVACSFLVVGALARAGRVDEAGELMDELVGLGNDVGLFSEEIDPETGAFLGNFPQGLTHLALMNAAVDIDEASQ